MHDPDQDELDRLFARAPEPAPPADIGARARARLHAIRGARRLTLMALADAAAQVRQKITANRGYQVTGAETGTTTRQGVPGRQGGYTSPGRDGRYAVFLAAGTSVQATIAGADLELRSDLPALTASVASLVFHGS